MKPISKNLWIIIKIILAILIFYLLFKRVGIKQTIETMSSMNNPLIYITLAFLMLIGAYILGALCLYVLLIPIKRIRLIDLFKYSSISWTVGLLMPTADIVSLSYFFKKEGIDWGHGLAINFLDKAITIFILGVLSVIAFINLLSATQAINLIITILVLFIAILALLSPMARGIIIKFILRKYSKNFASFSRIIRWYLVNKKMLLVINAVLTVIKFLFTAITTKLIFASFSIKVPIIYILMITAAHLIIKIIPSPINFLGIREAVTVSLAVFLYDKLGISTPIIIGTYIILTALNYLYALLTIILVDYKPLISQTQI